MEYELLVLEMKKLKVAETVGAESERCAEDVAEEADLDLCVVISNVLGK